VASSFSVIVRSKVWADSARICESSMRAGSNRNACHVTEIMRVYWTKLSKGKRSRLIIVSGPVGAGDDHG
jgi:hypothetical protein